MSFGCKKECARLKQKLALEHFFLERALRRADLAEQQLARQKTQSCPLEDEFCPLTKVELQTND